MKIIDFTISLQIAPCVKGDTDDVRYRAAQATPEDNMLASYVSTPYGTLQSFR